MKLLWLTPIMLPEYAPLFNEGRNPKGGWITGLLNTIKSNYEIDICSPIKEDIELKEINVDGINIIGVKRTSDMSSLFKDILIKSKPDIIHIWGTEKKMSLDMVNAAEELGMLDRVVINIQGLVSIISKYFYCYLPQEIINQETPAELKYGISLKAQQRNLEEQGEFEIEAFKKVKHVVGRTQWDFKEVKNINPEVNYYKLNESLRTSFYENQWDYSKCQKLSIFLSQSHFPLKGLHILLEAMPLILEKYPDAVIYTTGKKPILPITFQEKCSSLTYPTYIASLIDKYRLEDHVNFVGILSEKAMCEQYLISNVTVCCSSMENESNSIAEAMLLGMPVVSSDVGGIGDFVKHNVNGYLYDASNPVMLANYICKVFEDSDNAIKMGLEARKNAISFFDRDNNVATIKDIYSKILNS